MTKNMPSHGQAIPKSAVPKTVGHATGIREVARQAEVSIATVSRALGGSGAVSPQTRERIIGVAQSLGYEPSPLGRNLVSGRSSLLGVIVPNLAFPLYGEVVRAVEDVLSRHGMSALLASSHDAAETEARAARRTLRHAIDGGIVVKSRLGEAVPVTRNAPWVHISPEISGLPYRVELDNVLGGQLAAGELLGLGRRHLAYIGAPGRESAERERGFAQAVADAELVYQSFQGDYSEESGGQAVRALFDDPEQPLDAVFAAGDLMAAGVLRALRERGLRVPQDVAVVGFDDGLIASLLSPRLTSIRQPAYAMGQAAAELSLSLLLGRRTAPVNFAPILVRRESTGPP